MIPNLTSEQLENKYKVAMGRELGECFFHCEQELLRTSILWDHYMVVFGNEEAAKLFWSSGKLFSHSVEYQIIHGVVLGITRLFEVKLTRVSLNRLAKFHQKAPDINSDLKELKGKSNNLQTVRDEYLAHNVLARMTGSSPRLTYGSRQEISSVLHAITQILNKVGVSYIADMETHRLPDTKDAVSHLRYLYLGTLLDAKLHNSRIQNGEGKVEFDETTLENLPDFVALPDWRRGRVD
jgi:hypothetical protein